MIRLLGSSVIAALAALGVATAHAEDVPPPVVNVAPPAASAAPPPDASAAAMPAGCETRQNAIGLSRVVEIDASTAPRFGEQFEGSDFLAPGEVVLTFDDGPLRRYTQPILDVLDEECTKATFFAVGRMAIADPEMLREVAHRGHTLAVHTWSHKNMSHQAAANAKREFELGLSALARASGAPVAPFFRFPYLAHSRANLSFLEQRGFATFGIDVDSYDFRTRNPGNVVRNVMAQLARRGKGIILFHDIQPSTAGGLATLIGELKEKGYKIVHVVAKTPATTLPEFDAAADKMLEKKNKIAKTDPMATRAVTWPVAETTNATVAPPAAPAAPAAQAAEKADAPRGRLPWNGAGRVNRHKPVDWGNIDNDPWRLKAFGN